jgi:anti-sigma factor RsiW
MKNCLDIGIIQAFLDGELSGGELTRVSDHIGDCDSCAMLLAEAEDENAVVFPALAREFDTMVPTHRLWARIEDSIQVEKAAYPWYRKLYGILVSGFASPSFAVAAGLVIILAIFAVFTLRKPTNDSVAFAPAAISSPQSRSVPAPAPVIPASGDNDVTAPQARGVETASYRAPRRATAEPAVYRPTTTATTNTPAAQDASYLPGEESYVNTIASLSKSVDGDQDPNVMRASERVSYERDMAVVNTTIDRMRAAVKKNPKNEAAKQMLSAAYQNKIDLLNSVAQKEELVASLNR